MFHKYVLRSILIISTLLIVGCSSKEEINTSISGTVLNLDTNYILLSKVDDVQQKTTTVIDTLLVNENGEFQSNNLNATAIYTLSFNPKKTIKLAIDKNQSIIIKGTHLDSLNITGSKDTELLLAYETFRKESLSRFVYLQPN